MTSSGASLLESMVRFSTFTCYLELVMNFNHFEHRIVVDATSMPTVVMPLLHHYRTGLSESVFAQRMHLDLRIDFQGDADEIWGSVPRSGQKHFMLGAKVVSVQLQKVMRAWTHLLWCSDVQNLRDTDRTTQVLGYLASRPFYPKNKDAYGYDLLDDACVASIRRGAKIDMAETLTMICNQLRILGEHALADFYSPNHHEWFGQELEANSKMMFEFLAREKRILHAWIPMLGLGRPEKMVERARHETRVALSQFPRRDADWTFLAPALELEATAGIEVLMERPLSRQLSLAGSPERAPESQALLSTRPRTNLIEFPGARPVPQSAPPDSDLDLAA